jgi:hypothetical protein
MRRRAGWLIVPADRHLSVTARRDGSRFSGASLRAALRPGHDSGYVQTLRSLNTPR